MVTRASLPDDDRLAADLLKVGRSHLDAAVLGELTEIYRNAARFFDQDEGARRLASLPFGCGYLPFGREHSGDPTHPDQVDIFVASPRMQAHAMRIPSEPARALHASMLAVFDDLEVRAQGIAAAVAEAVGGNAAAERVAGGFRAWSLLQVHRTRPLAAGQLVNVPHEDGHALTFAHATAPGLEIEVAGEFVRTGHAMTVMPGHALSLLTGGEIPPLRHRVVSSGPECPRMSLMFFADLDPSLCAPWRSSSFNEGVDIGAFVAGNSRRFGVEGFAPG